MSVGGSSVLCVIVAAGFITILLFRRNRHCGRYMRQRSWINHRFGAHNMVLSEGYRLRNGVNRGCHNDLAGIIIAIRSFVKHGSNIMQAYEYMSGSVCATRKITIPRMLSLFKYQGCKERYDDMYRVALYITLATQMSQEIGCGLVRCLDAVIMSWKQMSTVHDLKKRLFAMPKATIRLLSVLPLATLLFGELLGAKPIEYCMHTTIGNCCFVVGGVSYCVGLFWVRHLLNVFLHSNQGVQR